MNRLTLVILCCLPTPLFAALPPQAQQTKKPVSYSRDILPILSAKCFLCHGPDPEDRKAKLRLDVEEMATKKARSGYTPIVPGHVDKSEVIARIFAKEETEIMPPAKHGTLKDSEKQLIKQWIAQGAKYEQHWSFAQIKRPQLPTVKNAKWGKQPLDRFILAKLEANGLQPSPEADRYFLARRVALDLTGLPPTLEMAEAFVKDTRPDAYERYVDQLLAAPAFGERWAVVWLDLARYADSNGYADDRPRVIWMYRDWVIKAINKNMPFDRFTVEQIAGDMLPNPSEEQLIATAFHRNTLNNSEGGTDNEEFRNAAVIDRVNTTMQVWMGLTMGCAQCHNHKYDPLSQKEYFNLFAIYNNSQDNDSNDLQPLITTLTDEAKKQKAELAKQVKELQTKLAEVKKAKGNVKKIQTQINNLNKKVAGLGVKTPIMRELPAGKKRKTFMQIRGNFLDKGEEVGPGVPAIFHNLPKDRPADRLALAQWLVAKENPLTARVTVNRFWERIFGKGLVETSEDFGFRGRQPSHPELLDYLADDFRESGWDVKRLLRNLVTSATYRQTTKVTPELLERDPDNRLFARGPRFRISAEMIRDQALFVSGLFRDKMYGPPVNPPRPNFGLRAAFGGNTDWTTSKGEDKHRRALYTQWRRSMPYPSMATFDAPNRNVCTVNRPRTNTPLQALVTLNDPVYVEAAQALARRMMAEGGKSNAEKAAYGFRLCLIRSPQEKELARLTALYEQIHKRFMQDKSNATKLATIPIGPLPTNVDAAEAAAWTVVGNVLLNLDEMFLKR